MTRSHISAALVALGIAASAAHANPVYVPLAVAGERAGTQWQTQILVSNESSERHGFYPYYVSTNEDGSGPRERAALPGVFLDGNRTFFFSDVIQAPEGGLGMLEIDADPELAISARLAVKDAQGTELLAVDMPVVSDRNLYQAGEAAFLHGWVRNGTRQTDFGLIGLEDRALTCSLVLYRADGSVLFGPWSDLPVPPRGHRYFLDALGRIGQLMIDTVRARVSCDGRFYPFAVVFDEATADIAFLGPAAQDSALELPGAPTPTATATPPSNGPSPTPGGPSGSTFVFERNGVFHKPTLANQRLRFNFPFQKGLSYRRIEVQMTVKHAGWYGPNPGGIHNFFWIARNQHRSNTFGYVNARGPSRNLLILMTNVDFAPGDFSRATRNAQLVPGHTYHVDFVYDTHRALITNTFTDMNDGTKHTLTHKAIGYPIITEGAGFVMDIGSVLLHEDVPSLGWEYSNLFVRFSQ